MKRRYAAAIGVVGTSAVGLAVAFALDPTLVPGAVRDPVVGFADDVGESGLGWTLLVLGGAYGLIRIATGRRDPAVAPAFVEVPPERTPRTAPETGHEFESTVEWHAAVIEDPKTGGQSVRESLCEVAVDAVAHRRGSRQAAEEAVETGAWTDDRVAAAFLGGDPAPGFTLRERLRGWFHPASTFERRVERTVDAIHEEGRP